MVDFGAEKAFAPAAARVHEHYGIEVPVSRVREATLQHAAQIGGVAEKVQARPPAKTVITEMDGSMVPFVQPGKGELDELAHRLWLLRREALRSSYLRIGVPVVEWRKDAPLQAALEEVRTFRRHARVTRA